MPHLPPNTCALFDQPLGSPGYTDSPAHIIPSSVGGRYKPKGILSNKGNNALDRVVDQPFMKIFGSAPGFFLEFSRDRGGVDKLDLLDSTGEKWRFTSEKPYIEPAAPQVDLVSSTPDANVFDFSGTPEQTRKFLKQQNVPPDQIEQLIAQATRVQHEAPTISMGFQPVKANDVLRFAWTAISLFAAAKGSVYSNEWRKGILEGATPLRAGFVPVGGTFAEPLGPIAHRIAVWAHEGSKDVYGYLQMFGGMGVGVVLTNAWVGGELGNAYCVDPLSGTQSTERFTPRDDFEACFSTLSHDDVNADVVGVFQRIAHEYVARGHGQAYVIARKPSQ